MSARPVPFDSSGFVVVRAPLLPWSDLVAWSDDACGGASLSVVRARLRDRVRTPLLREAIFLASPSLAARVDGWLEADDPERARAADVEAALVRYFARMSGRATPFGLFATTSVAPVSDRTDLELAPIDQCRRSIGLDFDVVKAISTRISANRDNRPFCTYSANTTLYRAGGRRFYACARRASPEHDLVAVDDSPHLQAVLLAAIEGTTLEHLVDVLREFDPKIDEEQAREFVDELVDAEVLVDDVMPPLTGQEAARALRDRLARMPGEHATASALTSVCDGFDRLEQEPLGVDPSRYEALASTLRASGHPVEPARCVVVDVRRPAQGSVSRQLVRDVLAASELIHATWIPAGSSDMAAFAAKFVDRYGEGDVPLMVALDAETGIGFGQAPVADMAPLLRGLRVVPRAPGFAPAAQHRDAVLARKVHDALVGGVRSVTISQSDIAAMSEWEPGRPPLPHTFAALAVAVGPPRGSPEASRAHTVHVARVVGPSGATLLGRFCRADPGLRWFVHHHLAAEERLRPQAVFAEVVHVPDGRAGNVGARPVLRQHEIPLLAMSGVAPRNRIQVSELFVRVHGGRVLLWSERLACEVIPSMTTAHNYEGRFLPVYRFLCALDRLGCAGGISFSWGPFDQAPFVPRLMHGRIALSLARWRVSAEELRPLSAKDPEQRSAAAAKLRESRRLPRWTVLGEGDNLLPLDLENLLSIDSLARAAAGAPAVVLTEILEEEHDPLVRGPEGAFRTELVVPFVRTGAAAAERPATASEVQPPPRPYIVGDDWLYAKIYAEPATADRILREVVGPFVGRQRAEGHAQAWHFIRYADPDWHLRVRIHGAGPVLVGRLVPALHDALSPLIERGAVRRLVLDTYEPETARYGGPVGMRLAERLFDIDSDAVLALLGALGPNAPCGPRWRVVLAGVDSLLRVLEVPVEMRIRSLVSFRDSLLEELADHQTLRRTLGERYRTEHGWVEGVVLGGGVAFEPWGAAMEFRAESLRPFAAAVRDAQDSGRLTRATVDLALSYAHMFANRVLPSVARPQELVVYDFLARAYRTAIECGKAG